MWLVKYMRGFLVDRVRRGINILSMSREIYSMIFINRVKESTREYEVEDQGI